MSLTRGAILLNRQDGLIFLRYRTLQAVSMSQVLTVFRIRPAAQKKTPIDNNRRAGNFEIRRGLRTMDSRLHLRCRCRQA